MTIRDGFELNDTALHWASSFNSIEVARLLLASGIDVDAVNSEEQTPLHIACKGMHVQVIQLLLSEGASLKSLDILGRTPKDLLPSQSDEIEKLFCSPSEPSMTLRNIYLKSKLPTIEEKKILDSSIDESSASPSDNNISLGQRRSSNGGNNNSDMVQCYKDLSVDSKRNSILQGINHDDADSTDLEEFGFIEKSKSYNNKDIPLLVLWPPTRKQIPMGRQQSLMLSSLETVLIYVACDSVDIFPILKHSGLIDVLERFHLSSQVKRASKESVQGDPKIRFCVDNNLCPGRHSFEIIITSDHISILASDTTGGLYGLYALIQLLQLHSKLKMYPDGAMALLISPIILRDSPDIMNRGILWSFRKKARTSFQIMKENIELFSQLRINMLFLVIDSTTIEGAKNQRINDNQEEYKYQGGPKEGDEEENSEEDRNGHENFIENGVISSNIKAFDEICENVCIELIPTVILSSVYHRLSLPLLKSFSHTMICLIFTIDLQSVRSELETERNKLNGTDDLMVDDVVTDDDCENLCKECFQEIFDAVMITGFSSITFSCSKWVSKIMNPTVCLSFLYTIRLNTSSPLSLIHHITSYHILSSTLYRL